MYDFLRSHKLETGEHYGHHFHNYTLIRHRDRLIYKVDGKEYGTIDHPSILEEINKNEIN
ncbi:uncharacterized protein Dmoj_GI26545 [Drosophila mojavensis]|uniref:Uncharacterized protein n=1 Tax=Drosophila mojavensis TaxID=7230 RepID=A0A0Q9XE23_DROMO|nr:uncharacterized protein Dmoj_GI26545 [Drosophila mojavensis]